jgi:hypothetical protein
MWAAVGAALAVVAGAGGVGVVNATLSDGSKEAYVPIAPCRLADTRPGPFNVGTRSTPIGAAQSHTFTVRGTNGNCTIPPTASAIVANVTAVAPTATSYMTVWPADAPQAVVSSLNYSAGQEPFPNAVTVKLSADGKIKVYNNAGSVHVIIDISGYYEDHDHDDRYYTKAQIDAVAGPVRRTLSYPAQSLNYVDGPIITPDGGGLAYTNNFAQSAKLAIDKPADFAGTGDVTLTITYYRATNVAGHVSFFARPQDWEVGDSMFADQTSVVGSVEEVGGQNVLRQNTISWPAAAEDRPLWNIVLQRNSSIANAYPDPVIVTTVSLSYDATR